MSKKPTNDQLKSPFDLKKEAHLALARVYQVESTLRAHPHNVRAREEAEQKSKAESGTVETTPPQEQPSQQEELAMIDATLIKGLEEYMYTGIGPSPALDFALTKDKSLFSRMVPHLFVGQHHSSPRYNKWPFLQMVDCGLMHWNAVPILDYLLKHDSDKEEVHKLLLLSARRNYGAFPFIFEYLWNAGYQTLSDQDLTEIYGYGASILFREAFDSVIFKDDSLKLSEKTRYCMYHAACHQDFEMIRYFHQKKLRIEYPSNHLYPIIFSLCTNYESLDTLKYLLTHYSEDIKEIDVQLQGGLYIAANKNQLLTVHYLVKRCIYSLEMIIHAREVATDITKEYLLLYNPETDLLDCDGNLDQFDDIEKLEPFKNLAENWEMLSFYPQRKTEFLYACISFGLVCILEKEAKPIELQDYNIFRLNLMNRLLSLDIYAANYAWALLKNEDSLSFDDLPLFSAKAYIFYVYQTNHIIEMSARSIFNDALRRDNDLKLPWSLSTLRAIKAGLVLTPTPASGEQQLLPAVLSSIVKKYVDFERAPVASAVTNPVTPSVTDLLNPGLTHLLLALYYSKEKCLYCDIDFSKQKNISFFSSPQKKIVVAPIPIGETKRSWSSRG